MESGVVSAGVVLDLKRVTAEVAARHGMMVRQDDPAMLLVTMNEVVLQQVVENIEVRVRKIVADIEDEVRSTQREAAGKIESEARKAGIAVREEIQKDIDAGRLHARELIAGGGDHLHGRQRAEWYRERLSLDRHLR